MGGSLTKDGWKKAGGVARETCVQATTVWEVVVVGEEIERGGALFRGYRV